VAEDGVVAGAPMRAGDAVLVVLAAANRDPAANADPARFDLSREGGRTFGFGEGPHRCPGEALAVTIAQAGVAELLGRGLEPRQLAGPRRYRPSVNARIPVLSLPPEAWAGAGAGAGAVPGARR
jgi:cytochrome P450